MSILFILGGHRGPQCQISSASLLFFFVPFFLFFKGVSPGEVTGSHVHCGELSPQKNQPIIFPDPRRTAWTKCR